MTTETAFVDVIIRVPFTIEHVGMIPTFLNILDRRPAVDQINEGYAHGGGWRPLSGYKMDFKNFSLTFAGDTRKSPIAIIPLNDELVLVYEYGYVAIIDAITKTVAVARLD